MVSVEPNMSKLKANHHLEIAARTWAAEKGREIGGIVGAWLKNNLLEFTRAYMSDVEERAAQVEKLLDDKLSTLITPIQCGQPERDAHILAEAQTELLAAVEDVLPYLPDLNDAKNYASLNEGRASSFQVAAIKLRQVYSRAK